MFSLTIRTRMVNRSRTGADWLKAARLALLHRGPDAVRVEPLARGLGVTKGSFYWHFKDRNALLEALLREWEEETRLLTDALHTANPRGALPDIVEELDRRNRSSERGESPSDAAIFAWAALDPKVARRANAAEHERMALFRKLTRRHHLADLFYYAYHGFLLRRRRVPAAAGDFAAIARVALRVLGRRSGIRRRRRSSATRLAGFLGFVMAAALLQSCTTMRILRHRDPAADRPQNIFPQAVVHRAAAPSEFTVAASPRQDLDTLSVRDVDLQMRPLAEYLRRRHVRAFVVVRDDTILYERYSEGYGPETRSSSFSVAKSVASALLGLALQSGAVRSLDDSVVTYVPELGRNPAYRGVTIRHLLGMKSGIAYTRTNGHSWHDLRSDDARFFYTTNLEHEVMNQHREDPPGLRWAYKDSDAQVLAWLLVRATGRTIAQQLESGIWRPMGAQSDASWDLDRRKGHANTASGLNATARDFARFGRLFLDGGSSNGVQVLPRDWVQASTTLDRSRTEPEVATWWQMQHQNYWWIPMQNWDEERDFFADGSRGQRIYVHPRSRIVIVQLANDSAQEFPFRKIVHYLVGEPFQYPTGIAGRLLAAARSGAGTDSVRALYHVLLAQSHANPAGFVLNEAGLIAVGQTVLQEPGRSAAGLAILELAVERSPDSYRAHEALGEAHERYGSKQRAVAEYREATRLAPLLAKTARKRL